MTLMKEFTFNSTRCIRNEIIELAVYKGVQKGLSTPHGALGTYSAGIGGLEVILERLSTPHGALGTTRPDFLKKMPLVFQLHTVH